MEKELTLRIIAEDLADIDFGERGAGDGRSRIYLGIQKGQEVVDTIPITDGTATFTAVLRASSLPDGKTNFLGPYAHGTRDARFCYLSWLIEDETGEGNQFGRVKLHLSPLRWEPVEAAINADKPFTMRVSLRGKNNKPVCASVPNDAIQWEN